MAKEDKSFPVFPLCPDIDNLSPEDIEEYNMYKGFLDVAFTKNTVHNIAVTGNFGIGKSRFLRWYSQGKKYLFVSGCSFMEQNKQGSMSGGDFGEYDSLENNLIYQLLLGCKRSFSESNTNWRRFCFLVTILLLLGTGFLLTLAPKLGPYLRELRLYSAFLSNFLHIIVYTGLLFFLCVDAYFLIRTGERFFALKTIRFEFGTMKVEAEKDDTCSALYRNRDTLILSLIDAADAIDRTVVFEDMDRLDNTCCIDLFTKLWELNKLVNLCVEKEKPIRFIYVLHDQLFSLKSSDAQKHTSGESVLSPDDYLQIKFFDYILPVVPRMSRNNAVLIAKNQFLKDPELLEILTWVAPYLSDYRLLETVSNEYNVFLKIRESRATDSPTNETEKQKAKKLHKVRDIIGAWFSNKHPDCSEQSCRNLSREEKAKLLSFCVYKTLMPDDYKKIREGCSAVFPVSLEKAQSPVLPGSIKVLIEKKWLDNTCLHLVDYDREGLENYIMDSFSSGSDAVVQKRYWLEKETDLCGVVLKKQLVKAQESCEKIPDLSGVEYHFAVLALKNDAIAEALLEMKNCCVSTAGACDENLLNQLREGLGLGKMSVDVNKNHFAVFAFLLKLNCPLWSFVPDENNPEYEFTRNSKTWWLLASSTCSSLEQCEILMNCCKENETDHLSIWAKASNCWYSEAEKQKVLFHYLKKIGSE